MLKWLPRNCSNDAPSNQSLGDRLREVECPSDDVVDAIGGWSTDGVGQGYGKGHGLEIKVRWMQKIV